MHGHEAHKGLRVRVVQSDIPVPYKGQCGIITATAQFWNEEGRYAEVRLDSGEVTTYRLSELIVV